MAITRIQKAYGAGGSTPLSVVLGATPTNGNVLILVAATYGIADAHISSVTTTNVVWARQVYSNYQFDSGHFWETEIWLGVVSASASATTSIVFLSTPNYGDVVMIAEYSGIKTSGFLDKTAKNNSGGNVTKTVLTGTTDPTTLANELWIAATGTFGNIDNQSGLTPINGFTMVDWHSAQSLEGVGYEEKIVTATGIANTAVTIPNNAYTTGCVATFKSSFTPYSHSFSNNIGVTSGTLSKLKAVIHTFSQLVGVKPTCLFTISGVTRDRNGNILGSCTVILCRTSDNVCIATTTSDGSGKFSFTNIAPAPKVNYYLVAFKAGSPDVEGASDNNIIGGKAG
jgi:hypothetical protein